MLAAAISRKHAFSARGDKDARTWKYDVQRRFASFFANIDRRLHHSPQLLYLLSSIFASGHVSALLVPATLFGLHQFADEQISPKLRLFWGAGHGAAHVVAALTCLIFVEFAAEWSADVGLVSVAAGDNTTLATSMYEGYEANFARVLDGVMSRVDDAATAAAEAAADAGDGGEGHHRYFCMY